MIRSIFRWMITGVFAALIFFVVCNIWVIVSTSDYIFTELSKVPESKVALVLGTSKRFADGQPNTYFENRMDAAAALYKSGRVKHLILSGDNRTIYYNEPVDMQNALEKRGIPKNAITLDYAGLRTLDSVVRSKKVFGQKEIIVVTQKFHSYRAVFIGKHYNMETYAYAAESIPIKYSFNVLMREFLARPKAVIDLFIIDKNPRHLGEKEPIPL